MTDFSLNIYGKFRGEMNLIAQHYGHLTAMRPAKQTIRIDSSPLAGEPKRTKTYVDRCNHA
jgi:hypothetical protein